MRITRHVEEYKMEFQKKIDQPYTNSCGKVTSARVNVLDQKRVASNAAKRSLNTIPSWTIPFFILSTFLYIIPSWTIPFCIISN